MEYRNSLDKSGECSKNGKKAEDTFLAIVREKTYIHGARQATLEEQFQHIDHVFKRSDGREIRVDTKAMKKVSRNDNKFRTDLVWVEFKNVNGNPGWLYGKADFISFERENDFVLVDRKKLSELCERLVNKNNRVDNAYDALYNSYTRAGRKDVLSQIKMDDVLNNTEHTLIKKY
jgi:hypothetical protein